MQHTKTDFYLAIVSFLQDKRSFRNSSHMFHSFKFHAHLVHCGSNSLLGCFFCKPLEINRCGNDSQAMKTEICIFFIFFLGKGFWDYKHEFQQNLGYATMTFQEDLRNGSTSSCHMLSAMNIWFQ